MRAVVALAVAAAAFASARAAKHLAAEQRVETEGSRQFTPSPTSAPFVCLGYREAFADVLFVRLRGVFGDVQNTAEDIAAMVEAIVALDPQFHRIYEFGAGAMTLAREGVDQAMILRALAVLDRGMAAFPDDYKLPYLAGQIYLQDLVTNDPAQRYAWDDRGTLLLESAVRKPGAPLMTADAVAVMRTKLGQHERAVQGLREMLLITDDAKARRALVARLASIEEQDADEIAAQLYEAKQAFETKWKSERPYIPASWYILLGPRLRPGFDQSVLALGDRDVVGSEEIQRLEPLE